MMDIFIAVLTLMGSLGIFLYGMKLMSEALQKVAGSRMRKTLSAITATPAKGVASGIMITGAVQSSSAITTLVISFVNAGLIPLTAAIAVIIGANIGTTFTAWLVSILGFTFSISKLALPLIGVSFPLIISRNRRYKPWGELLLGISFLFLGLEFVKNVLPNLQDNPETFSFLFEMTGKGLWSIIFFFISGVLITALLQSSSASMALILALVYKGLIPFDIAAAMVIGMNIGTTVTANLAALVANVTAKRAARAHFLFNLIGASWALLLFRPFLMMVDWIFRQTSGISFLADDSIREEEIVHALPLGLALLHTLFNIITAILIFPFISPLSRLTKYFTRQANALHDFKLKYLSRGLLSTPELSTFEARKQIGRFGKLTASMFDQVHRQFFEMDEGKYRKLRSKVIDTEDDIDKMRLDIRDYLTTLSTNELSEKGSQVLASMQRIIEYLENIGDLCLELSHIIDAKVMQKVWFSQAQRDRLKSAFIILDSNLQSLNKNLEQDYAKAEGSKAIAELVHFEALREEMHKAYLIEIKETGYRHDAGNTYRDMFAILEQISDHIKWITHAIVDSQIRKKPK